MAIPLEKELEPFSVLEWEPLSEYAKTLFKLCRELRVKVLDHRAQESAKRASLINRFRIFKQLCAGDVVVVRPPCVQSWGADSMPEAAFQPVGGGSRFARREQARPERGVHRKAVPRRARGKCGGSPQRQLGRIYA